MNYILIDGITNIDEDLIEDYFKYETGLAAKKTRAKVRRRRQVIGAAAACICLITLVILPMLFESSKLRVSYPTYDEVVRAIDRDTLLNNIDSSSADVSSIKAYHKNGEIDLFEKLELIVSTATFSYELEIDFAPRKNADEHHKVVESKVINGISVEIFAEKTSSSSMQYIARFEYNSCGYVIKVSDDISFDVFDDLLNDLLKN